MGIISNGNTIIDNGAIEANEVDTTQLATDAVETAKIADANVTSAKISYPLTTFSSTGIDDNATANALTIDSSSNLQFNSGYGSVATAYGCRAWVNFDGTGVSIREDGNVTSITDNGTGDYTVNFTTAMPDDNYCATCFSAESSSGPTSDRMGNIARGSANYLTSSVRVVCNDINDPTVLRDQQLVVVSIFR